MSSILTLRRLVIPALTTAGVGTWATITTVNDDWDDYLPRFSSSSNNNNTKPEKIVILGSGWGGLNVLQKCAGPNKDIVVVSPRPHFLYTPLLAGSAVGTITLRSACEPLRAIVESAAEKASSATYVRADARHVDLKHKKVYATTGGGSSSSSGREMELELDYDKLIVAVGAQPNTFGIPGVQEHALFLKEAEDSAKLHARLLSNLEKASALLTTTSSSNSDDYYEKEIDRLLTIVVVGGGPTGVELSAELADFVQSDVSKRYGPDICDRIQIILVEAMPRILAPFDASLAQQARQHLESRGVEVRTSVAITKVVDGSRAVLAPSVKNPRTATAAEKKAAAARSYTQDMGVLVWAAGVGARPLVKQMAKALNQSDLRGLQVDEYLRVKGVVEDDGGTTGSNSSSSVYAIGDAALSGYAPTAQVAAQQGKYVGRAIRDSTTTTDEKKPFVYHHAGSLCCLGTGNGIAQLTTSNKNNTIWEAIGASSSSNDDDDNKNKKKEEFFLTGAPAFALWRSLYWTRLLSTSSRLSLSMDWLRSLLSGRDVVEPVLKRTPTLSFGTPIQRNSTIRTRTTTRVV